MVDLQTVQKLIAIFLASPHIARIRVLLCAQEVSAMCGRDRPGLALLSDRRLEWRCRTRRRRSRLALARARLCRLTALTGLACAGVWRPRADGSARASCRSSSNESADKLAPFSRLSLLAEGAPWLIIRNLGRGERGHWVRCPTTSTTICGHQFDEGAARQRRSNLSGP